MGVLLGVVFVVRVDDTVKRRTIGGLLLAITAVHLWQQRRKRHTDRMVAAERPLPHRYAKALAFALFAGFTTMVANAGGAVMSLYLLSAGFAMLGFLGTAAWFFFIVNVFKLPFSVALGLITIESPPRASPAACCTG